MDEQKPYAKWTYLVSSLELEIAKNNPDVARISTVLFMGAMIISAKIVDFNFDNQYEE